MKISIHSLLKNASQLAHFSSSFCLGLTLAAKESGKGNTLPGPKLGWGMIIRKGKKRRVDDGGDYYYPQFRDEDTKGRESEMGLERQRGEKEQYEDLFLC